MKSQFCLIIDFDSTLISVETLEYLADISIKNSYKKKELVKKISHYTNLAMNGEMAFEESLDRRFNLMKICRSDINNTIIQLQNKIDQSFLNNIHFFKKYIHSIYVVSGGFKSIISPVLNSIFKANWNIYANEFLFNKNNHIIGINKDNPLAFSKGKVEIIKKLNLDCDVIIIGDGYTDYEIKKFGEASTFIQFIENINRKNLNSKADFIACNFNEIINYIDKKYFK